MPTVSTARHRRGMPGGIPVSRLTRVRRSLLSWFRPGRHRAPVPVRTGRRLAPATA